MLATHRTFRLKSPIPRAIRLLSVPSGMPCRWADPAWLCPLRSYAFMRSWHCRSLRRGCMPNLHFAQPGSGFSFLTFLVIRQASRPSDEAAIRRSWAPSGVPARSSVVRIMVIGSLRSSKRDYAPPELTPAHDCHIGWRECPRVREWPSCSRAFVCGRLGLENRETGQVVTSFKPCMCR